MPLRELGIVALYEAGSAVRRWELWLPYIFSATLGLFMVSRGFGSFGGKAAERFFVLGWIPFSTVTAASLGTITVVLGLSHQSLRYWLSLPLSVRQVVAVKLVMGVTMGLLVAVATLVFAAVWILHSAALVSFETALVLLLLTFATSGLLAALSIAVRDITKMSILRSAQSCSTSAAFTCPWTAWPPGCGRWCWPTQSPWPARCCVAAAPHCSWRWRRKQPCSSWPGPTCWRGGYGPSLNSRIGKRGAN